MTGKDKGVWEATILNEITTMFDNGVCELVEPPKGCTIIGNKWVFRVKTKAGGTLDKM